MRGRRWRSPQVDVPHPSRYQTPLPHRSESTAPTRGTPRGRRGPPPAVAHAPHSPAPCSPPSWARRRPRDRSPPALAARFREPQAPSGGHPRPHRRGGTGAGASCARSGKRPFKFGAPCCAHRETEAHEGVRDSPGPSGRRGLGQGRRPGLPTLGRRPFSLWLCSGGQADLGHVGTGDVAGLVQPLPVALSAPPKPRPCPAVPSIPLRV